MISQTVSLLGSMLVMYSIMWHITLQTKSGLMMTIMVMCSFIPSLLITPFAGVWADRLNRKMLMITADFGIAFVTLIIAILFFFGYRDIWILFVVSIVRAFGQSVHQPAVSAVYPQIVPETHLIKVQGIAQGIQSSSMVLMPLLAGLLLSTIPLEFIMMIDVITAAIAIMILFVVKLPKHEAELKTAPIDYFEDIKRGIHYAFNHKFIFKVLLFGFLFMLMVAAPSFLTYLQVARVFGDEAWRLSTLEAIFGTGMLLGSLVISAWGGFNNRLITFFLAYIMIGLGTIGMGIPFNFAFYIGLWGFIGFFIAISNPILVGLIQEKVDKAYIGRVFSVFGLINTISLPLGMLLFGPLSDVVDISLIILGSGIGMVLIAIVPLFSQSLLKEGFVIEKPTT
ncbi:MFS transporter [Acholeplasma vituli]|uniref:MFS transporter n=1 Tax=Paracholeplasma vituli TaxID=69473 RepID=A0ABT2PXQ9_9MOLU|nr:MFS transporter [Paracholeplasma vituli]MCU0105746.1 MFS transporter [Paracholeplasma vituli]